MENNISALLEMDKQARLTVETARQRSVQIISDAGEKCTRMGIEGRQSISEQTKKRSEEIKSATDKEIARIEKKADSKCSQLDEKMAANKQKWKKEILKAILG